MRFIWYKSEDYSSLKPITQVYGVCFNMLGQVLIFKSPDSTWNIPGGSPEKEEVPIETLKRELKEEVDITIRENKMIGYYKVISDTPSIFQLRYVAIIDKLQTQTEDPDTGIINERKFVHARDFFKYVKIEDYRPMIEEAVKWFRKEYV